MAALGATSGGMQAGVSVIAGAGFGGRGFCGGAWASSAGAAGTRRLCRYLVGNVGAPKQVMRLYPEGLFVRKTAAGVPLGNSGYGFGRTCGRGVGGRGFGGAWASSAGRGPLRPA